MVTAIYSLSYVYGAELWLLFWFICLVAYLSICFAIKANRSLNGIKTVLIGALVAEVIVDAVWALIYYRNGIYTNYGVGAVYGLLMWIPVLIITGIIVTIRNQKSKVSKRR